MTTCSACHRSRKFQVLGTGAAVIGLYGAGACATAVYNENLGAESALEARLPRLIDSAGIPGFTAVILSHGKPARHIALGVLEAGTKNAVTPNTVFEAASLSKPVLAYTVLRLVDEGRLTLDQPLTTILPLTDLHDPRARKLTARMVLAHTTGLQNERIGSDTLALQFDPGSSFRYSGEGYTYLGHVVEKITGESLNVLAQRLVFGPLHMARSAFVWEERFSNNAAVGHGVYGQQLTPGRPRIARAAATLHTTAKDYGLFLSAIARGQGLSSSAKSALLTPVSTAGPGVRWTAGWGLEEGPAGPAIWHHGDNSSSGFTAFAWLDIRNGNGIVYFANSTTGLGIVRPILSAISPGIHPSAEGINYESFDSPARLTRLAIYRAALSDGAESAIRLYRELKSKGPPTAFEEGLLNSLGYRFLNLNKPADAVSFFQENARVFPTSFNVFDSLGDGLAAAGKKSEAIDAYRKSLDLNSANTHAKDMIEQLSR